MSDDTYSGSPRDVEAREREAILSPSYWRHLAAVADTDAAEARRNGCPARARIYAERAERYRKIARERSA
jgi:hypothetical protein